MSNRGPKSRKRLPQFKKDIKDFISNEEGRISKKNIIKLGMSLAILGIALQPQDSIAGAHNSHTSHSNGFFDTGRGGHTSSTTHTNVHANHGSHGSGGWC